MGRESGGQGRVRGGGDMWMQDRIVGRSEREGQELVEDAGGGRRGPRADCGPQMQRPRRTGRVSTDAERHNASDQKHMHQRRSHAPQPFSFQF